VNNLSDLGMLTSAYSEYKSDAVILIYSLCPVTASVPGVTRQSSPSENLKAEN
jgi:hypothetical protein